MTEVALYRSSWHVLFCQHQLKMHRKIGSEMQRWQPKQKFLKMLGDPDLPEDPFHENVPLWWEETMIHGATLQTPHKNQCLWVLFNCAFTVNPLMPIVCCTYCEYSAAKARVFQPLKCNKKQTVQTVAQGGLWQFLAPQHESVTPLNIFFPFFPFL